MLEAIAWLSFIYFVFGTVTYLYYSDWVIYNKSKTIRYEDYPVQIVLLHPIFAVIALCKSIKKQCIKSVEFTIKILDEISYSENKRRGRKNERLPEESEN